MDGSDRHPDAHQLAGAAAREAASREALGQHDWRRASKILYLSFLAGDWRLLGHESRGAYYESLGITRGYGYELRLIGQYWWAEPDADLDSFADALESARLWRREPNGVAA